MVNGGARVAAVLRAEGVRYVFTLCGGHISPILVGCKAEGIGVIDVRDEANAVFAADGMARLSGIPGVAVVTAGPGVTNGLTAVKNAHLAQSPLVLLGGASATILRGRGSLQDIDQLAAMESHVKWSTSVKRLRELAPAVNEAFRRASSGVPGPVFVECPIDLLYDEPLVRSWYQDTASTNEGPSNGASLTGRALAWYIDRHLNRLFAGADWGGPPASRRASANEPGLPLLAGASALVKRAQRPVLVIGSQALNRSGDAEAIAAAVDRLGMPTWLAGMARGLLGRKHALHMRHKRRAALKSADLVILAGVPADFRMDYGRVINRKARVIAVNLAVGPLFKNLLPTLPVPADPGRFLIALASRLPTPRPEWQTWKDELAARDASRDAEIEQMATQDAPPVNALRLCQGIEKAMSERSTIVVDGGDFVASAAYVLRPRQPLGWLDPGVFGTLGVGAGFAMAAALAKPEAETWLIYGDGAAGFSMVEFDTFARHRLPVIAVIGNDAAWTQIARDQITLLGDDVATNLARTDYNVVAAGLGAVGLVIKDESEIDEVLARARTEAAAGRPVLINAHIGTTRFRDGSISV